MQCTWSLDTGSGQYGLQVRTVYSDQGVECGVWNAPHITDGHHASLRREIAERGRCYFAFDHCLASGYVSPPNALDFLAHMHMLFCFLSNKASCKMNTWQRMGDRLRCIATLLRKNGLRDRFIDLSVTYVADKQRAQLWSAGACR